MMKNTNIFQSGFMEKFEGGEKCKDFSKWFHCYGQPAQMEYEKCFERGLIIMGDLPGRKEKMSEMT
jgi:hypothetical protein